MLRFIGAFRPHLECSDSSELSDHPASGSAVTKGLAILPAPILPAPASEFHQQQADLKAGMNPSTPKKRARFRFLSREAEAGPFDRERWAEPSANRSVGFRPRCLGHSTPLRSRYLLVKGAPVLNILRQHCSTTVPPRLSS